MRCACLLLLFLYGKVVWAYDFQLDGLCYNILWEGSEEENGRVEVTYLNNSDGNRNYVIGDLIIPSQVTYEDKTYTVETIGDAAFYNCFYLI